ncbi:LiaF transmembrane domain-containing protein [Pedobacter frigiditerrae]|uniref:LiaF transmembrane domain-containing protein n=1 Tax=Pedobacter frigiditerrae TaxID=2530452 RepID=UPI00292EC213|nr:LiaF domain-containing protein [Pedobacter frigiditerrae]
MENNNINENKEPMNNSGKLWAGLIIVVVGSLLLVNNIGFGLPSWLFHWSNILILIGLFIGFKHNFKNGNGLILIIIGAFFTLKEAFDDVVNFDKIGWPALIIALGLFLILKPKSSFNQERCGKRRRRWQRTKDGWKESLSEHDPYMANPAEDPNLNPNAEKTTSSNDFLDSVNVFGGSHQTIYTKNFKGGEVTAVFGGCDLNLTQADFEGEITIDITAIFGGCKIIIPPGWHVKSEVTAIFGGLDDKRSIQPLAEGPHKLLIIKGIAMFGGVDIRNY